MFAGPDTVPVISEAPTPRPRAQGIAAQEKELLKAKSELDKVKRKLKNITVTTPGTGYGHFNLHTPGHNSDNILIIPSADTRFEQFDQINEDLMIMGRILSKQTNKQDENDAYNPFNGRFWGGASEPKSTFIDGYGVIFEMYVDFPLSPTEKSEPKEEEEEKVTEWIETKKEIFSPQQSDMDWVRFENFEQHREKKEYNEEKVKRFEHDLIGSLKNASNIRNLDDDEQLIMVVRGSQDSSSSIVKMTGSDNTSVNLYVQSESTDSQQNIAKNTIVIRAKKEIIDKFAKGHLDHDEFLEEIEIIKY
jgi:hypothetical protein